MELEDEELICSTLRTWSFMEQWKTLKMFLEATDKKMIDILYSIYHPFSSKDYVLRLRKKYGDSFVSLSTNYTRAKAVWLEDPVVRRKETDPKGEQYNQFREKSAYLSDGGDRHLFFFLKNELDVQARRISNMESKMRVRTAGGSGKTPRKKSSVQRASNIIKFTKIFDGMSSYGKLSCLSRLSDVLDWRLCYFMSVFLATRKFIDFFSQLPENISKNILRFLGPECLLSTAMVNKTWKSLAEDQQLWKAQIANASFPMPEYDENLFEKLNAKDFFMKHARRYQRWKTFTPLSRTISKWPAILVVKLNEKIICGGKGCIRIWESSKINIEPEGVVSIGKTDPRAFIPYDKKLLVFCSNGYFKVLDFTDCEARNLEEPQFEQKLSKHPLTCATRWLTKDGFTEPQEELILVGDGEGNIITYSIEEKSIKMKKKVHKDEVLKLSVHRAQDMEDALIVSGGKDFCIKVTKFSTLQLMHSFSLPSALTSFHILSEGGIIIIMKNSIARHHILQMKITPVWESKVSTYFTSSELIFQQDGLKCMILVGTIDGKIYIVEAENGVILSKTRVHRGEVKSMLQIEEMCLLSGDVGGLVLSTFA